MPRIFLYMYLRLVEFTYLQISINVLPYQLYLKVSLLKEVFLPLMCVNFHLISILINL